MTRSFRVQSPTGAAPWELPAWAALLVVSLVIRLYDLGVRVMSHDESIHAVGALTLYRQHTYTHDPTYHGPLQYYANALIYFLFGATDFTARLAPALAGTALVGALWAFRRYLGRQGAFAAAAAVSISPALVFYSRYAREDIYVALFGLIWVYAALRYMEERRTAWLVLLTGAMALAFITKENSFLLGAVVGSFFGIRALLPAREASRRSERAGAADLAALMLTLVLPFASGFGYLLLGWKPGSPLPPAPMMAAFLSSVLALSAVAAAVGFVWFRPARVTAGDTSVTRRTWAGLMAFFWGVQLLFFTALFAHPIRGVLTGVGGSVGYWLGQHGVNRGSQPPYYYLVIGALYEFLPLLIGLTAIGAYAWRRRDPTWDPVPPHERSYDSGPEGRSSRRRFFAFAVWWIAASWLLYGWAGERMPWLLVHQVLPLCLLAGWGIARLAGGLREAPGGTAVRVVFGSAVFAVLLVGVLRSSPSAARDPASVTETTGWWVRALALCLLVAALAPAIRTLRPAAAARLACLGMVLVLGVLTLRTSLRLTFVNYDLAAEPMSYAQGSPDIRRAMQLVESLSERTAGARAIEVAYDDQSAWPIVWYLRDFRKARTWGTDPAFVRSAPIVIVGPKNRDALQPHVSGYVSQRYVHYWWPIQDYLHLTPSRIRQILTSSASREHLWQVFFHRNYGLPHDEWPSRREFEVLVRRDVAASPFPDRSPATAVTLAGAGGAVELEWQPVRTIEGTFNGKPLLRPTAIGVAPDGSLAIADAGNHRIVVLDRDGSLRLTIGNGRCVLRDADQPGCVDPDGSGPRAAGDGQFDEPWGVAVSAEGDIFAADTWNGRIQVFAATGAFRQAWGRFGSLREKNEPQDAVLRLYGPRGLAIDDARNLVVADTGNKRLIVFSPDGAVLASVGPDPPAPEFFDEPTAVGVDSNHTLLVADAWNGRIVRLDVHRRTLGAWRVNGWSSRSPEHKPFVAADAEGRVYASDPESGRVLVFSPAGVPEAVLRLPDVEGTRASPAGLAFDPVTRELLVVDRASGRVLVMPAHTPRR